MSYVIKDTSGLINTRLTDVGRRNLSQGNFNISYFQIGDSEINYTAVTNYDQVRNNILMPAFNAQNDSGSPQSNKQHIKYPFYLSGNKGNTYGIPFMDSNIQSIYNSAGDKGFFVSGGTKGSFVAETSSAFTITSNYFADMSGMGDKTLTILLDGSTCAQTTGTPSVNDFVTIFFDGNGGCGNNLSTTPILTYRIQDITPNPGTPSTPSYTITLDRSLPKYSATTLGGQYARVLIYPSGMTQLYDFKTPAPFWQTDTLNFESPCDVTNRENTLIWNMNIPWSENPAGLFDNSYEGYNDFGSVTYLGTKEYLGYQQDLGQKDTSQVFYYNSFDEKIVMEPNQQKAISIIHYTNQDIDNVYGEKFSTVPFDPQNPTNSIGLARNFKLKIPTLMWHKSTGNTIGETFWIDPPGFDSLNLCKPYYIKSNVNVDMNDPGIRYFHLWDTNLDDNGNLNRVGKVFPDQQIIIIDDEEIIAAMSNKSNRNWTLPAPGLSLLTPNTCFSNNSTATGILTNDNQVMWVTYRLDSSGFTNSLHCNYYSKIVGPSTGCTENSQNVAVRFGPEFLFLNSNFSSTNLTGYCANSIRILCQLVNGKQKPSPTEWREIDFTSELSATTQNGYLTMSGLTGTTLEINIDNYQSASIYDLSDYIDLTPLNDTEVLNFGDEYYFYGNLETDITATIYEMRYLINLGRNQFTNSSNPSWSQGSKSYVTEVGLYDNNKDLLVVSKLQSPELRQGVQQYVIKLDF